MTSYVVKSFPYTAALSCAHAPPYTVRNMNLYIILFRDNIYYFLPLPTHRVVDRLSRAKTIKSTDVVPAPPPPAHLYIAPCTKYKPTIDKISRPFSNGLEIILSYILCIT